MLASYGLGWQRRQRGKGLVMNSTTTQKAAEATNANGQHTNTGIYLLTGATIEEAPTGKPIATEIATSPLVAGWSPGTECQCPVMGASCVGTALRAAQHPDHGQPAVPRLGQHVPGSGHDGGRD
jgi:hypothetical protein